ncbi:membrane protein insertion efficiency factor YidD [Inhella sp.]|uniref:membrane protein insertion efficiency factor YidD n=1 Tax=Inhella sp. TaxID=1921806 RepID=UPI0035AD95C5
MQARTLALALIRAYQRWISPHKGFVCAHRAQLGGPSCSQAGARLIQRRGLRRGLPLLRERLLRCGAVHRAAQAAPRYRPLHARGDCDCGVPDLDCGPCDGCDACDACDACDLFDRKKKDRRREDRAKSRLASRR